MPNVPPSKGVGAGGLTVMCQVCRVSEAGRATVKPSGGDWESSLNSCLGEGQRG